MVTDDIADTSVENTPLKQFSGCHDSIMTNFQQLLSLNELFNKSPDDPRVKVFAKTLLAFFKKVVLIHHSEEEDKLFTAVTECSSRASEAKLAREYIKRLIEEHRDLEKMWEIIEPDIKKLARGKPANIDMQVTEKLATQYLAHAAFEEHYFLPLSAKILSDQEMTALGLTLHMKLQKIPQIDTV